MVTKAASTRRRRSNDVDTSAADAEAHRIWPIEILKRTGFATILRYVYALETE